MCRYIYTMEDEKLLKFINGNASIAEQQEIINWIEKDPSNKEVIAILKNIDTASGLASLDQVDRRNKRIKGNHFKRAAVMLSKVAAIALLCFTVYQLGKKDEESKWVKNSAEQITEIKAPLGESVHLVLPDGSNIKLNSGSVMRFNNLYGYENRIVELDGEGYFEINKDNLKFIVATSDVDVEVLGTTFNISAYSTDRVLSANLYEGSVRINNKTINEKVLLSPSESYSYDKLSKRSSHKTFNKEYNWLDNYFVANKDDIEEFVKKVQRKYNVEIVISPDLKGKCMYTGVFKGESLKEILDNMVLASPIQYRIDEKGTVFINYDNH